MNYSKIKGHTHIMEHKGFKAGLMRAERLADRSHAHSLPPGSPINTFPVDALPGSPDNWLRGPGNYVCPIEPTYGLWFDWTMNDDLNTAVIASVKGMNPITGQKLEELRLEKYQETCPVHEIPFQSGLFCEKCNYKWPPQSYVASPNILWWDGFRQPDGTVRQFFFTEEDQRDIASLVIGKENTVPAFGFAFYQPVTPRQPKRQIMRSGLSCYHMQTNSIKTSGTSGPEIRHLSSNTTTSNYSYDNMGGCSLGVPCSNEISEMDMSEIEVRTTDLSEIKDVSVGAGAKIHQDLRPDPLALTEWKQEPSSVIRLYFVFENQFREILSKGVKDLEGDRAGYLQDLPVG